MSEVLFLVLSNSGIAFLLGADADGIFDGRDKDLAVANFARLGRLDDGPDGRILLAVRHDQFDFIFGRKSTVYSLPR